MSETDKHKTFVWKYFDRGISKHSKGVTDEAKSKNCAAEMKCTGCSTSGLPRHPKSKHSIEKPSSTQSDVTHNTQSASSTKCFMSAYSQATQHSFMNKNTREEIVAKLVAVDGFHPSAVCKSESICQAFSDKGKLFQKYQNHVSQLTYKNITLQKMLL